MTWRGVVAYLCALNNGPPLFRFPLGARVRWSDSPETAQPWRIVARRYTHGEVSAYVEYFLVSLGDPLAPTAWAYEPDCQKAT